MLETDKMIEKMSKPKEEKNEVFYLQKKLVNMQKDIRHLKKVNMDQANDEHLTSFDLERDVRMQERINKQLSSEIKRLKKVQHDQANKLVEIEYPAKYESKLIQLQEEQKFNQHRLREVINKYKHQKHNLNK